MKRMGWIFLLMVLVAGNACAFFMPPQLTRSATPLLPSQNFLYNANDQFSTDTYDANGNTLLSEIQVSGFTSQVSDSYDFRNRLIRRIEGDTELDYSYNARGTRIGKVKRIGGAFVNRTLFVVDEQNLTGYAQTLEEWTDTGSGLHLNKVHTYGLDLISTTQSEIDPISGFKSQVSSFYCYDGHGSVRALADETGTITDTYSYDAFGNQLSQSGTTDNAYRYCGEYFDADLHLYYLRARHLNPNTGRFHTLDTYEGRNNDPLSLHKYLYAHANPVMGSDPSGMVNLTEVQMVSEIQQILRNGSGQLSIKVTMRRGGCMVFEYFAEEAIASVISNAGIYIFRDAYGIYTGKSVDIERRLVQHGKKRIHALLGKIRVIGLDPKHLTKVEQIIFDMVREISGTEDLLRKTSNGKISNRINPVNKALRKVLKIC